MKVVFRNVAIVLWTIALITIDVAGHHTTHVLSPEGPWPDSPEEVRAYGRVFTGSMGYQVRDNDPKPKRQHGSLLNKNKNREIHVELPLVRPGTKLTTIEKARVEVLDQNSEKACFCFLYHYALFNDSSSNSISFRIALPNNWTSIHPDRWDSPTVRTDEYDWIDTWAWDYKYYSFFRCVIPPAERQGNSSGVKMSGIKAYSLKERPDIYYLTDKYW